MARSGDDPAAALAHDLLTVITTLDPKMIALYEAVLDDLEIGVGTRVLDVGRGPGLFLRLAAQRGAIVAGVDAVAPFPYPDGSFDVVTGFNTFQFAADPGKALREAGRVSRPGTPIVIATWGRPDQCEAAAYVRAVGPPGAPDPFALSEPGTLEEFAARGGLTPGERREVLCVWSFPDETTLLRALKSTGFAVQAIDSVGEDAVTEAVTAAIAPYRTLDAGYRVENTFTYLITHRGDPR
jgi:SAM-dependent methyltransferase